MMCNNYHIKNHWVNLIIKKSHQNKKIWLTSSAGYDEMERMSSNAMGNNIVSMAYTYDIQNRLRKINDPANLYTMETTASSP